MHILSGQAKKPQPLTDGEHNRLQFKKCCLVSSRTKLVSEATKPKHAGSTAVPCQFRGDKEHMKITGGVIGLL